MADHPVPADSIAVIGMSCRFPEAPDPEAFWDNLAAGRECLRRFTPGQLAAAHVPEQEASDPGYVPVRGVLDGIELFDAEFFGMPPREAAVTDPQHRLLLECAWEAAEDAGHAPDALPGHVGVYAGTGPNAYLARHVRGDPRVLEALGPLAVQIGNEKDHAATRIAYRLGLRGPAVAVQTACSTSLVAVHMACRALLGGECDMALAGGACVSVPQESGHLHTAHDITSPDGHCRTFDRDARGTVAGNGAGLVLLKLLPDALRDGDRVIGVIRGSAVNNDGPGRAGYTAPRLEGQADVLLRAYAAAGVSPDEVDYVEAHGTGTEIGDSIEVLALTEAFRRHTRRTGYCRIGSVKPNIGHLDAAAGIAGLIKVLLALRHEALPPSINYRHPNPEIPFADSPFLVNDRLSPWPAGERVRRAGVSSFGMGGTNAHVVVEEPPRLPAPAAAGPAGPDLVLLSARTPAALEQATERLARHLESRPQSRLADVAHTSRAGRTAFRHRRAVVCAEPAGFRRAAAAAGPAHTREVRGPASVALLLPGQGTQYPGMAGELYRRYAVFREAVDLCAHAVRRPLGIDLRDAVCSGDGTAGSSASPASPASPGSLDETWLTQPALFTVSYALGRLLQSWGLEPSVVLGHSLGEYTAACLAGAFDPADGALLVTHRGRLVQQTEPGAMLAVRATAEELEPLLGAEPLDLAAVNGPRSVVVSGPDAAVAALEGRCAQAGLRARRLPGDRAFHSRLLDPVAEEFRAAAAAVRHRPLRVPLIANETGRRLPKGTVLDAGHWVRHLRAPVLFHPSVQALSRGPRTRTVTVEAGPGHTLSALVRQTLTEEQAEVVTTMPGRDERADATATLLAGVGDAWTAGASCDWPAFARDTAPRRVSLPTYPFQRARHWIDLPEAPGTGTGGGDTGSEARCARCGSPTADGEAQAAGQHTHAAGEEAQAARQHAHVDGEETQGAGQRTCPDTRPTGADTDSADGGAAPATPDPGQLADVEQKLVRAWQDLLGAIPLTPESDFFAVGGESLLAVRLLGRVRREFGVRLTIRDMVRRPTVRGMASAVLAELAVGHRAMEDK
ncbi:hypothetical protein BFF78_15780 [Streptomyces fodineus]|uniref:Uncharacterized protein n=1 Tax=Streptomyces fodineus TaxID=1904616 RepID=A0A1D7Y9N0_9ACTN|nr:type I polyketide synthase [Streptomyces fodineus]AOR32335.1 hypothetical protein BFF78_15780 [Streptomyces fodineus]